MVLPVSLHGTLAKPDRSRGRSPRHWSTSPPLRWIPNSARKSPGLRPVLSNMSHFKPRRTCPCPSWPPRLLSWSSLLGPVKAGPVDRSTKHPFPLPLPPQACQPRKAHHPEEDVQTVGHCKWIGDTCKCLMAQSSSCKKLRQFSTGD